jgi:hypothetical protein
MVFLNEGNDQQGRKFHDQFDVQKKNQKDQQLPIDLFQFISEEGNTQNGVHK